MLVRIWEAERWSCQERLDVDINLQRSMICMHDAGQVGNAYIIAAALDAFDLPCTVMDRFLGCGAVKWPKTFGGDWPLDPPVIRASRRRAQLRLVSNESEE